MAGEKKQRISTPTTRQGPTVSTTSTQLITPPSHRSIPPLQNTPIASFRSLQPTENHQPNSLSPRRYDQLLALASAIIHLATKESHIAAQPLTPPVAFAQATVGISQPRNTFIPLPESAAPLEFHSASQQLQGLAPSISVTRLTGSCGPNATPVTFMVDSGASALFMGAETVRRCGLVLKPSDRTIKLADGTVRAAAGTVVATCTLKATGAETLTFTAEFCVTEHQDHEAILGMPWLHHFNPAVDWRTGRFVINRPSHPSGPLTLLRVESTPSKVSEEVQAIRDSNSRKCTPATFSQWNKLLRKGRLDLSSLELVRMRPTVQGQPPEGLGAADTVSAAAGHPGLIALLNEFKDVAPEKLAAFDPTAPWPGGIRHQIELVPDAKPHAAPLRRYSPIEDAEIRRVIDEHMAAGRIRESTSPWGAMVLLARKKDGTLRFCVDYRMLNNKTVKNRYALPLADDCFDRARGARIFSKLDLHSGFWQIPLDPASAAMTAFRTRFGHYEYTVLPMGLCNAPGTFMHVMNSVFRKQLDRFLLVFLDDIFVFSSSEEEHLAHLREVLEVLRANRLYLKPSKCEWMESEVEFLGHRIGREGLSVDPHKVDAVRQWPTPTSVTEVRSFLGLAGYYRRFLENYSRVALPLTELTKDEVEWRWNADEQNSFDRLKTMLSSAPVLQLADPSLPYVIHCDASGFAIGACLMQDHGQGLQPVSYISAKMKPAETRYAPHEQELLALVYACKSWRHYLHNGQPFKVMSDHQSLRFFTTQPLLSSRQARWKDALAEFDFSIHYIEGPKNVVADAFSRRADHKPSDPEMDRAINDAEIVTREQFLASITIGTTLKGDDAQPSGIPCPGRSPALSLCAARLRGRRLPAAPIDPIRVAEEREKNKKAAEVVAPAAPDLPEPNDKGVIVMPTQRCTADTKERKQCGARTKRGQHCFAHRKKIHGTRIKPATSRICGLGLFTTRAHTKDDNLGDYSGELIRGNDPNVGGPYYLGLRVRGGAAIDAARTNSGDGRWVNDPRGIKDRNNRPIRPNCYFATQAGSLTAKLRALRDLAPNEELFVSYGAEYWKSIRKFGPRARPPVPPVRNEVASMDALNAAAELSAATMVYGDFELIAQAREAAQQDPEYSIQLSSPPEGQTVRDGLLWAGNRLVVPNDLTLRTRLLSEMHDTPTGGHFGRDKTQSAMRSRFIWPGMASHAAAYVSGCDTCQRVKHSQQRTPGLLMPLPVPEDIDSHWTMDFVTGLPCTARGHDAIQGHFSRGGSIKRLYATDTTVDAVRAADGFIDSVVRHHGVPASIVSDRGPQFISRFWEAIWARLGTSLGRSTGYHAETDGLSEREQKTMVTWLRAFCTEFAEDWDRLLPLAELALNCMPQASSGVAPYELLYGRNPALTVDRALSSGTATDAVEQQLTDVPAAEARWKQMAAAWTKVRGKLLTAQQRMATNADKHRREAAFKVGDTVLLSTEHLKINDAQFNRKLAHLFCGPFPVTRVINANAYELELPDHMHIHAVVNITHLRPYRDGRDEFPDRPNPPGLDRPPPDAIDDNGNSSYVVERILAQQSRGRTARYLVLWKGYSYTEATWEDADALEGAQDALKKFRDLHRTAGHKRRSQTNSKRKAKNRN